MVVTMESFNACAIPRICTHPRARNSTNSILPLRIVLWHGSVEQQWRFVGLYYQWLYFYQNLQEVEGCHIILLLDSSWLFFALPAGVVEISPSGVAPVCLEGDQLELTCTSSGAVHRWEFTVFPENIAHTTGPILSVGTSGSLSLHPWWSADPWSLSQDSLVKIMVLPLVSRTVVSPVSSGLNRTVVNCFEGISSNESAATTTIWIIDPRPGQFGKKLLSLNNAF